ncbi:hypothetical protein [Bacillus taeanensis]|uniref:Uncharacterized protein n=1 Tax=Bacillus taeanensis TaxID=273032 RepID=A0A366XZN5_9BACI|nr:hypothetical protein [Bacillus taeanensis]RBW69613.1 hypothetical protein DS031_10310 [Bacillus taeanensis]
MWKLIILIVLGTAWLLYAVGFAYFGLLGFWFHAAEKGFRPTLCGTLGCSDLDFFFSVVWLLGMIFLIYVLPIGIIIYFVTKKRKAKIN